MHQAPKRRTSGGRGLTLHFQLVRCQKRLDTSLFRGLRTDLDVWNLCSSTLEHRSRWSSRVHWLHRALVPLHGIPERGKTFFSFPYLMRDSLFPGCSSTRKTSWTARLCFFLFFFSLFVWSQCYLPPSLMLYLLPVNREATVTLFNELRVHTL